MKYIIPIGATLVLFLFVFGIMAIFYPDSKISIYSQYKFTTQCHGIKLIGDEEKRCIGILKYYYE